MASGRGFGSLDAPSMGSGFEQSFSGLSMGGGDTLAVQFAPKKRGKMGNPVDLQVNFFSISFTKNTPNYFHYNIEIEPDDGKTPIDTPQSSASAAIAPAAASVGGGSKNPRKGGRKGAAAAKQQQQQQQPQLEQQSPHHQWPQKAKDTTPKSKKSPKRLNDDIFRAVFKKYPNVFQCKILPVFDGEKNFYSTTRFRLPNNRWTGVVSVKDKEKTENFRVNITTPEMSHAQNLNDLTKPTNQIMPVALQAMDIIMRFGARLCKISLGQNFFFKSSDPRAQEYQFEIGRDPIKYGQFGHYQATKKCEAGLFYNVDRAMAVFTYGGKLTELIDEIRDMRKVEELIKSLKFNALHLNYKRSFIIQGFSKDSVSKTFFNQEKNGVKQKVSVYDYFKNEYPQFFQRYKIDPNQVCVQVGSRSNAKFFPIETVDLEADEVYRRKLDPFLQGMVTRKSSQQTPFDRFKGIKAHIKTITQDNTIEGVNYLQHFGIGQIDAQPAVVKGRIIDAPLVEYNNGQEVNTGNRGGWDMKGVQFFKPSDIGSNWAVVNVHKIDSRPNRSSLYKVKIDQLVKGLISDSRFKGVKLSNPKFIEYEFNFRCRQLMNDFFTKLDKNMKIVFFLIPKRDEIYNEIKAVSELNCGIITQCLNQEQRYWQDGLNGQLFTNFFLKVNPKTQGVNQSIKTERRPPILRSKLMIIGLDVTHPSPNDGLSKSIAACVGSYTKEFDKCHHRIVVQEKARKEVVSLKNIVMDLLKGFKDKNNFYPAKIIVYRDGIGEGDFEKVINVELDSVKKACSELGQNNVTVTYIMVQKRHNCRFIPTRVNPNDKANRQNVQPGMMGTSRPCKYVVLHDENEMSADEIQCATYYLCYLYPRCTKASSIPPHVFYAHLMAKRARSYLAHLEMDSDGRSSVGSGGGKLPQLSAAQINEFNQSISVRPNINGILFFI